MSTSINSITFESINKVGQTGDLVLFNSRKHWYDFIIEYFSSSHISHIGMILKNPIYLDPSLNDGLYILESCIHNTVDDEISHTKIDGVQINKLDAVLEDFMNGKDSGHIYYRFLNYKRDIEFDNNIKQIVESVYAKPYDTCVSDWLNAELYLLDGEKVGDVHKTDTFWCSALIAYIYVKLGFLNNNIPWTIISPGTFSINNKTPGKLVFTKKCKLLKDMLVKFTT